MAKRSGEKGYQAQNAYLAEFRDDDVWVPPSYLIKKYGKSRTYWYLLRKDGLGPEFIPLGHRSILYRLASVLEWIASLAVRSLSDPKYREIKEQRRIKRQERIRKNLGKGQKDSMARKADGANVGGRACTWLEIHSQRLRSPRFLAAGGAKVANRLHSAGEVVRRIADRFALGVVVDRHREGFCSKPITARPL